MFVEINKTIYNTDDFSRIDYNWELYVMSITFKSAFIETEELTNTEFAKLKQMLEVQKIE